MTERAEMTMKVLIVDDSKLARIVVGKAVTAVQPDWVRVEAASADEAVGIIASAGADLAILDYNMPGRNGIELAEQIRAERPDMPIAIATANVQDEIISQARAVAMAMGMSGCAWRISSASSMPFRPGML